MKTTIKAITIIFFVSIGISASGQGVEQRNVPAFNAIKVFGKIKVNLKQGSHQNIEIRSKGIPLSKINTYVEDGLLKVKITEGIFKDINVTVDIVYTKLRELTASGGAEVFTESPIAQKDFYLNVTSGSYARLHMETNLLDLSLNGGGQSEIDGKSVMLKAKVFSGAQLSAFRLQCENVVVKTNTGGQAEVYASNTIDASSATGGRISYKGRPSQENVKGTLGGEVVKVNR